MLVPMKKAKNTGNTPISKESRPPYISLVSMSRPNSSVPKMKPSLAIGKSLFIMLALKGSAGAIQGAKTAAIKISSKTVALINAMRSCLS